MQWSATIRICIFSLIWALGQGIPATVGAQLLCGDLDGSGTSDAADALVLRNGLTKRSPLDFEHSLLCNVINEIRAAGLEADPMDLSGACSMADASVMARSGAGLVPASEQVCPLGSPEPCSTTHVGVGCNRPPEVRCVCAMEPECCTIEWGPTCVAAAALPQCAEYCGNGSLEPTVGEQCDDGNVCNYDGCLATGCVREQSAVLTLREIAPGTVGFDLDDADGDGNIHTGIDNILGANGTVRSQFNGLFQTAMQDGSIIEIITIGDLDNVPYSGSGTPGYQDDPDVVVSLYPGVDPMCPSPPLVPWLNPANAPWELFSDSDAFTGCTPPGVITDADHPANGIYPTSTAPGPPPAPYLHAQGPQLTLSFGVLGDLDLLSPILEATVTNDGSVVTGLENGVLGGLAQAEALWRIDTTAAFGGDCPTALHFVLALAGGLDQNVSGFALDSVTWTCGGFCLIPCILGRVTINDCRDGETGAIIPDVALDGDCVLDPRIEDGYSVAFQLRATQVHVISQESRTAFCP